MTTVLLELLVAERFSLSEIESARAHLPESMPPAYAALPECLAFLVSSAKVAERKMKAQGLSRPRTAEEAGAVLNLVIEVVQDITQAPVKVSWRFPPHLTPQGAASGDGAAAGALPADSPVVELEAGDAEEEDDWTGVLPDDLDDESLSEAVGAALSEPIDPTELQDTGSFPLPEAARHRAFKAPDKEASGPPPVRPLTPGTPAPPPTEAPALPAGRRSRAPKVIDPFSGLPKMAPAPAEEDDDEDAFGTEIITQVISPRELAARIEEADRAEAAGQPAPGQLPLGGVRGFETGTPALGGDEPERRPRQGVGEESLELDPETGDIGDLLGEDSADSESANEGEGVHRAQGGESTPEARLEAFLAFLEEGLYIDPGEADGVGDLEAFTQRVRGEVDGLGAQLSWMRQQDGREAKVEAESLLRGVEALITLQERCQRALEMGLTEQKTEEIPIPGAPAPQGLPPAILSQLAEPLKRLTEGRRLSRRQLTAEFGAHPELVEVLSALARQVDQWREGADVADEALRRLEALHGQGSSGAKVSALEQELEGLKFQVATWEQEAQQLRVLAAWGNLRALVAELREEVAEVQSPRNIFPREALSAKERDARMYETWEDVQRYLGVLHNKLPRETLAPVIADVEALAGYFRSGRRREPFSWP